MKKFFIKTNFLLFFFFIFSIFSACTVDTDPKTVTQTIVWKGSFASADEIDNPQYLWAYYNTTDGCSYIYDGEKWTLLAASGKDGVSTRAVILYELNGGTLPEDAPLIYTYATPVELVEPVNDPYNFEGFYYNADFSGQKVTELDDSYAYGQVLYAKWSYSITFHFNDGQESRVQVISDINSKYTFETLERSGYRFDGWFTDENFSSEVSEWNDGANKGDITLYAKWTEFVTITYISSDPSYTEEIEICKGDKAENINLDTYIKDGIIYTLVGWSETIDGALFDFENSVTSDLTLYAQWSLYDTNSDPEF